MNEANDGCAIGIFWLAGCVALATIAYVTTQIDTRLDALEKAVGIYSQEKPE